MNENLKFKEQWAMKQNKIFNWIIISSREMLFGRYPCSRGSCVEGRRGREEELLIISFENLTSMLE